jgi:hypothetical protein
MGKNTNLLFNLSHETPHAVISWRENTNHYNKILDNSIVDNQN